MRKEKAARRRTVFTSDRYRQNQQLQLLGALLDEQRETNNLLRSTGELLVAGAR